MAPEPTYMKARKICSGVNANDCVLDSSDVLFFGMSNDPRIPFTDGKFIAAALSNGPIFYSSNSGESFTSYNSSSGTKTWKALIVNNVGEKITALVGGARAANTTVWRSNNFGLTWFKLNNAGQGNFGQLAANAAGNILYVSVNNAIPAIKYSYNGGSTWFDVITFDGFVNPVKWVALATDYSGNNVFAASEQSAVGGGSIFRSTDKGLTYFVMAALPTKVTRTCNNSTRNCHNVTQNCIPSVGSVYIPTCMEGNFTRRPRTTLLSGAILISHSLS